MRVHLSQLWADLHWLPKIKRIVHIDLNTKFAKHYLENTTTRTIFCGQTFNSLFAQGFMLEEIMGKSDQLRFCLLRWRDVIRNTHLRCINQKIFLFKCAKIMDSFGIFPSMMLIFLTIC